MIWSSCRPEKSLRNVVAATRLHLCTFFLALHYYLASTKRHQTEVCVALRYAQTSREETPTPCRIIQETLKVIAYLTNTCLFDL
ncbi:hypothetical protein LY76DRAFT_42818 [Colletotrichum caudatum]|nr:hypothetical protein LY76DRAFT_42818 [Colletotrichum caudatum]